MKLIFCCEDMRDHFLYNWVGLNVQAELVTRGDDKSNFVRSKCEHCSADIEIDTLQQQGD